MNPAEMAQSLPLFPRLDAGAAGVGVGLGPSDAELQKMLIDERMRCESHKTNYQTLKAEHTRLQDKCVSVQGELRRVLSDGEAAQDKLRLQVADLGGKLLDKTREVTELQAQVMTPQRLELLRAQVQQEMEAPVRKHFNKLEKEAERYRTDYNRLRYELTLVQTEAEHQRDQQHHLLEDSRIRHEAEMSRVEREKADLIGRLQGSGAERDGRRVEALLREKAQLHQRMKCLQAEVEQLRAERDSSGAQAESVQRVQARQLGEAQAAAKALEAEKQSVRLQLERVEKELVQSQEQNTHLTSKLHKAERAVSSLTSQVEEMKHSHKLDLASVRLECVRARGEAERERDALQEQLEGVQADVEVLRGAVERSREQLVEREREMVRRVQVVREEESHKMTTVQEEKLEVENRLAELEQQRVGQEAAAQAQLVEWEERLHGAQLVEESARKELQSLRAKVQQQGMQLEELEGQKAELAELRRVTGELSVQAGALTQTEREVQEENSRLREVQERLREELRSSRAQMERTQREAERLVEERRIEWLNEKHVLQEKHSQANERLHRAALAQKKRKTKTEAKEKKLQDKIQLLEARVEELQIEVSTAKKRPARSDEHTQLHRRLRELQRRHNEFRHLLLGNQGTSMPLGPSLLIAAPELTLSNLQDEQHQRELALLRRRLEELETSQQQQLEDLAPPVGQECEDLAPPVGRDGGWE